MKNLYLLKKWLYKNNFNKEALAISNINNFYKKAISEREAARLREWFDNDKSKLSFDDLFEGKLRTVIPFAPEDAAKIKAIVTLLKERGWEPSGGNFRFDTKWVTQKLQTPEGNIIQQDIQVADLKVSKVEIREIPSGPRAGETIEKERTLSISKLLANRNFEAPEWMSEWWQSKQTEYTRDWSWKEIEHAFSHDDSPADYSIIISRHPIDVLRMSDHENIRSCHSEGNGYFHCAIKESRGHGPIAMLVKNDDLEDLLQPPSPTGEASEGIDISDLDGQEIFKDRGRGIRGITPRARVRLRKYVNEEEGYEFAIPEDRKYGSTPPGFIDVVRKWSWTSQKHLFEGEDGIEPPDEDELLLYGGSYRDSSDADLLQKFFEEGDVKTNYYGNVGTALDEDEDDVGTLWAEELDQITHDYNSVLKHVLVHGDLSDDDWQNPTVWASADLRAEINLNGWEDVNSQFEGGYQVHPGDLKSLPVTWSARSDDREFENCFEHDEYGEINNIEIVDNKLIVDVSFSCEDCLNPDDVSNFFEYVERDIDSTYNKYLEKVRRRLVEAGYIREKAFDFFAEKAESFNLSNLNVFGDEDDYDGEILISPKSDAFELGLEKLDLATVNKLGMDQLIVPLAKMDLDQEKTEVISLLNNIEKKEFEGRRRQLSFSFYQPDGLLEYSSMINNLDISAATNLNRNSSLYGMISPKISIYVYSSEPDKKLQLAESFIKQIDKNFEAIKAIVKKALDRKINEINDKIRFEAEKFYRGETARPIIEKLKGYHDDVRRLALWIEANWDNFTEEEKEVAYNQYLIPTERNGDYIHDEKLDFPKWWSSWAPNRGSWSGVSMKDIKVNNFTEDFKEDEEELELARLNRQDDDDEYIEYSEEQ